MPAGWRVEHTDDAAAAVRATASFLGSRPVEHNLIATLLHDTARYPGLGRTWWVTDGERVEGVALQMPAGNRAVIAPTSTAAVEHLVDAMARDVPDLPGVTGDASTAASFAGRWAETRRVPAHPIDAGRLYRMTAVVPHAPVPGRLRLATAADEELVVTWATGFGTDTGDDGDTPATARYRLAAGRVWLWEDTEPAAMASAPMAVYGVARVGAVYTPPARRRHGYATAVVAALSQTLLSSEAEACILYTQLSNPTSNAIYQRLGYEPVAEVITYGFDGQTGRHD